MDEFFNLYPIRTYLTNYDKALEQLHEAMDKGGSQISVKLQSSIKFNGGGHINHSIFWKNLLPVNVLVAKLSGPSQSIMLKLAAFTVTKVLDTFGILAKIRYHSLVFPEMQQIIEMHTWSEL
ncbi:hypothetical protein MKW98_004264 [Papaver atlanticum]|uniref:superoxide dismutase n=1 Tax=Papaver atlanticum TaxID=357466 RepID=A0AAD4TA77_9MAGN|nr:hypothetical protein MKW98_004264 [Papaver atlanticum]